MVHHGQVSERWFHVERDGIPAPSSLSESGIVLLPTFAVPFGKYFRIYCPRYLRFLDIIHLLDVSCNLSRAIRLMFGVLQYYVVHAYSRRWYKGKVP